MYRMKAIEEGACECRPFECYIYIMKNVMPPQHHHIVVGRWVVIVASYH